MHVFSTFQKLGFGLAESAVSKCQGLKDTEPEPEERPKPRFSGECTSTKPQAPLAVLGTEVAHPRYLLNTFFPGTAVTMKSIKDWDQVALDATRKLHKNSVSAATVILSST